MVIPTTRRSRVAVVTISGMIGGPVRVPIYTHIFDELRRKQNFKAVVVDIDSPGGSASGSEALYYSMQRLAETKPVVACIRGVGASGAYMLSCAATKVVALPHAIVGSIGVIYLRPVINQLLQKVGAGLSVYKGGHLKDMGGFWRTTTSEEDAKFQELISELYEGFVSIVAHGRNIEEDQARKLATGEVFTGRRAAELGLVDEIGDFERALELAAGLGKTQPRAHWIKPKPPILARLFAGSFRPSAGQTLLAQMQPLLTGGLYHLAPGYSPLDMFHYLNDAA
jgi:protease-4